MTSEAENMNSQNSNESTDINISMENVGSETAKIKFNVEAIKNMYQNVGNAITELDEQVRHEYGGKPVEEISFDIQQIFGEAGIQVDVLNYAQAVSQNIPFQFVVQ